MSVWLLGCCINWNICLWCDLHAFRMQLDLGTVEGVFLDNVGASEASLQLPEHMKLDPLFSGWVSPMLETRNRGLPHGRQRSSIFEGCSSGSFITPCGWSSWQGLSCNGWHTAHCMGNAAVLINVKFLDGINSSTNICNIWASLLFQSTRHHNGAGSCKYEYLEGPYGNNLVYYSCPQKSHSFGMVLDKGLISRLWLDGMMKTAQSCRCTWVNWGLPLGMLLHWVFTAIWGPSSDFWLSIYINRSVLC